MGNQVQKDMEHAPFLVKTPFHRNTYPAINPNLSGQGDLPRPVAQREDRIIKKAEVA